jgi:hypothetical protein
VIALVPWLGVAGAFFDAGVAPDLAPATPEAQAAIDAGVVEALPASPEVPPAPFRDAGSPALGRLHGRVLAKGSRLPVPAAKIDPGAETTAQADLDGRFELTVACGPRSVVVRAPGFETMRFTHDACAGAAPLSLRLLPRRELPIYETVVVAQRGEPSVDIRGPDLTATPGSLGDPFRTLESLPGVATVAWPLPVYAIRGANPGNTGFFLDDVQVPALFHLLLGPSVIHPYFFDSLAFYPGGYPERYGRYVSGLVTAQTRAPVQDGVHGSADLRLYDAGALVSAPLPDHNGAVAAAFRYSYTGPLLSLLRNDLHLSYWDYQLRADRRVGAWRASLLLLGSSDDLSYPYQTYGYEQKREIALQFHRASLRASTNVAGGQLVTRLTAGADHSQMPIVQNYPISVDALSIMPRLAYQRASTYVDFEVGMDGQLQWLWPTSALGENGLSDLARQRTAVLLAGYVSGSIRAGSRLILTPGVRLDSYTIGGVNKMDLGPRLTARFPLDGLTWISASGGRFSQPPSLAVQIPGAENFGLALYGLQTSWQGSLGLGTKRLRGLEIEVTGYAQRYVLTDVRDPVLVMPDPLADDFLVRRDALAYGVEVMIRRPFTERLYGWLAYTLSTSQRALEGGVIGPSDWDQRHILNAVLGYRHGFYTFGARGHLNTGRPVLVRGAQAESFVRLPVFYQLDLRAERRILFDAFTLSLYLEVVNATATREVIELDNQATLQQPTGVAPERSYRIVLPSLGVRGEL